MSLEGAEWCLELRSMDTLVNEGDKEVARRYDVRAGNTGRGTKWRGGGGGGGQTRVDCIVFRDRPLKEL